MPADRRIAVHDETAGVRHTVPPMRPSVMEGTDEEELSGIVPQGCLIGTVGRASPARTG